MARDGFVPRAFVSSEFTPHHNYSINNERRERESEGFVRARHLLRSLWRFDSSDG
jgi:hypothetical protein